MLQLKKKIRASRPIGQESSVLETEMYGFESHLAYQIFWARMLILAKQTDLNSVDWGFESLRAYQILIGQEIDIWVAKQAPGKGYPDCPNGTFVKSSIPPRLILWQDVLTWQSR